MFFSIKNLKYLFKNLFFLFIFISYLNCFAAKKNAEETYKFAYIDMQRAIQSTSTGKKAKKDLEKDFEKKKKSLEKAKTDIEKMSEDLKKKESVLSEDIVREKKMAIDQEMLKYRELVGKSQFEIQQKERELTAPIIKKLKDALDEYAEKEKYSMVFEKSENNIWWAKKSLDITDIIVKKYEEDLKKKK